MQNKNWSRRFLSAVNRPLACVAEGKYFGAELPILAA
jgi:hypothetical protein